METKANRTPFSNVTDAEVDWLWRRDHHAARYYVIVAVDDDFMDAPGYFGGGVGVSCIYLAMAEKHSRGLHHMKAVRLQRITALLVDLFWILPLFCPSAM